MELKSIDVDIEVYKALTFLLETEETTYNDVLRSLLNLNSSKQLVSAPVLNDDIGTGWTSKNVTFPNGTIFRADFKGNEYRAAVENDIFIFDGKPYKSLSEAAALIAGNQRNGWTFWDCKLPNQSRWKKCMNFRRR